MTKDGTPGVSLRRLVLTVAITLGVVTVGSMLTFVFVSASIRRSLEASAEQLMVEQQIADQIVSSSYSQQLIAYRYLERPDDATLAAFRERGTQAYDGVRRYLFLQMPVSARLKVEAIKEAHQNFEVTAERAFDLAKNGETKAAQTRIAILSLHADTLERAVRSFVAERAEQRRVMRDRAEASLVRLQRGTMLVAISLALARIFLVIVLRQRVMIPLEAIAAAVRRLGPDAQHVRLPAQRYREFELVATGFNGMADRIQATQEEVGARNRELTLALEDLQRTQQQLVQHEKLSAMGEMLAGLAHELNNPLAGILGISECMKADLAESSDPQAQELLASMVEPLVIESHRARDLVLNLLHFARQSAPQLEVVKLSETIDVAFGLCRHTFVQAQKTIDVDVAQDLYVRAQSQKLEHAIINIMNNAIDALSGGTGSRLTIKARRDDDAVIVTFEDDGPGFQQPDRVFDPFYTTKGVGKGTGLGLALVHEFVGEFGGSIVADNTPSGGARLVMRLVEAPMPLPVPTPSPDVRRVPAPLSLPAMGASRSARRQRILIVDDEAALRAVQCRLLSVLSVDVETATTGVEARDLIALVDFDVVITDLRMPGEMDGCDLLMWIERERPALAERVLVVTGDIAAAMADGRLPVPEQRVLKKPFGRDEYLERVQGVLAAVAQVNDEACSAAA